jgi:hypothetical protein
LLFDAAKEMALLSVADGPGVVSNQFFCNRLHYPPSRGSFLSTFDDSPSIPTAIVCAADTDRDAFDGLAGPMDFDKRA